ncbi:S-type anion channel SLAH1-like protein [Drosera capensis]
MPFHHISLKYTSVLLFPFKSTFTFDQMDPKSSSSEPHIEIVFDPSIFPTRTQNHKECKRPLSRILTKYHGGYFRISFSLCSQALLWKTITERTQDNEDPFKKMLPSAAFALLWSLSLVTMIIQSLLYALKCVFQFERIKAEFLHHVGVNYMFAPWISCLLLLESSPFRIPYHQVILWAFVIPIVILDIKIYGQWFTKGKKRYLARVANPTCQLSVVANLIGARLAAGMGYKEAALCLFSTGMAHYLVLFVTLYQRLPGNDGVPTMLRPVFFLFIATPSMASLAWESINGSFDTISKMLFFLSLFIFMSLVCRPMLFRKSMRKFSIAWWAYSFPLTILAVASTEYAQAVECHTAHALMLLLSLVSILVFFGLVACSAIAQQVRSTKADYGISTDKDTNTSSETRNDIP